MRWQLLLVLNIDLLLVIRYAHAINIFHSWWLSSGVSENRATLDEIEKIFMFPSIFHGLAPEFVGRVCDLYLVQLHSRDLLPCSLFRHTSETPLALKRSFLLTVIWILIALVFHHYSHFALPAGLHVRAALICDSPH